MHILETAIKTIGLVTVLGWTSQLNAKPLRVVYLQGFKSCSNQKNQPVQEFFKAAKNNPDAKLFWGCFDGAFLDHPTDISERFYLFSVDGTGNWSKGEEIEPDLAASVISSRLVQDHRTITESLEADGIVTDGPNFDLFLSGHSHGGWLAMKVAYQLSLQPAIAVSELLTIDPVSYKNCSSKAFPWHVIRSLTFFNFYATTPDCHRAPTDLEKINPYIAKAIKGRWTNYFQTSMPFLSSGPISHTRYNYQYDATSKIDWITSHLAILVAPEVWEHYNKRLQESAENQ